MDHWTNDKVLEFIELYKNERLLWDANHKAHRNRSATVDAWERIRDSFSLCVPVADLKRKKESLMTTYRTRLKKKKDSIRSGARADDVYETCWFAYAAMDNFLNFKYDDMPTRDSENPHDENEEQAFQTFESPVFAAPLQSHQKPTEHRRTHDVDIENARNQMKEAFRILKNLSDSKNPVPEDDECNLYGKLIEKKLRRMPEMQRQNMMYEIDGLFIRWLNSSPLPQYSSNNTSSPMSFQNTDSPQYCSSPSAIHIPETSLVENESHSVIIAESQHDAQRLHSHSLQPQIYIVSDNVTVPAGGTSSREENRTHKE